MDEVKIESKFISTLVSKLVESVVRKKLDYDADIKLNHFRTAVFDDKAHIHLDVDVEINKAELDKLLKSIGV